MLEKSLVLIKPDAVEKDIIGEVISYYEKAGLKIVALKMERATEELAEKHYAEHKGKPFYEGLIKFITRSPLCALIVEGDNALEKSMEQQILMKQKRELLERHLLQVNQKIVYMHLIL